MQVNLLDHLNLSIKMETIVSIKEMEEVTAAKNTRIKNTVPSTVPRGMLANTFGRVMNISPAPAFKADSSPPEKINTDGTIINPAKKANPVSKNLNLSYRAFQICRFRHIGSISNHDSHSK